MDLGALRQNRKLLLTARQFVYLLSYGKILFSYPVDERRELLIHFLALVAVYIYSVYRFRYLFCGAQREDAGKHENEHRHPQYGADVYEHAPYNGKRL